jgi:predicted dehydrogenase
VLDVATVGCGAIASWHLDAIERAGAPVRVVAAVDPIEEHARRIAARTGARAYAALSDAVADGGFVAAIVLVPHHLHEPVACEAFAAGLHVLLEKPMAPTMDACRRILGAARDANTVFMVAENAQYWPEVHTVKRLLDDGAIGEIVTAHADTFFPALDEFYASPGAWRLDRDAAGGGIAVDTGSHWLRPLRIWLGEAESVVAVLGRPYDAMEGESLCRALIRFQSGIVASFDGMLTTGAVAPGPLFRVTGTLGELTVEPSGWVKLWDGRDPRGTKVGQQGGYLRSYEGEHLDFAAAVLEGTPPAAPPEYALGELQLAHAMYRSAVSGRFEPVANEYR